MSSPIRASWSPPFVFTEKQRIKLSKILARYDKDQVNAYLDEIQWHIVMVRMDWGVYGEAPPQSPADARRVLKKISKHAKALFNGLEELDLAGSEMALLTAMNRLGRGSEAIKYMNNDLPLLWICADGAVQYLTKPSRGRPADSIEQGFIATLGRGYFEKFSKKPSYSRGTIFPTFVAAVLSIALPGNPHSVNDNAKIVKAALKNAGVIS